MKNYWLSIIIIFAFIFQITTVYGQLNPVKKRVYTTVKLNEALVIDGEVDDKGWDAVQWSTDFTEKMPDEGTKPSYQTKFKIAYDAKYLYVAIRAFDENPELIQKRLSRRDGFAGDRVNVLIDSYHDKRTAFVFTTTAAGVKGDEIATRNGNNWDDSWNPIWFTKARIDDKGWTAEMKIPLSQLRFGDSKEQVWGLNVIRNIFRKDERSLWQRIPNSSSGFISDAGELHGLKNLKAQKQLEIQPFTVLQYDSYPAEAGNPFKDGSDFKINGGIDAKIGVTNDLTLDLTINPDFGQVEADPGNFSLDGFQIFLEEKRPFFVENKNIFDYKYGSNRDNLFYSRRIGRSPHKRPVLANGEFSETPINTTILGAAKFSGKTKTGWSIGVLESVTNNEYATIAETNGGRREEIVEPLTNYLVLRTQKDFNKRNSYIGGIFTATNRNLKNNFSTLHKAAYTGGIDFKHQWDNRNYFIEGNFVASKVLGSKEAIEATQKSITHLFQRADATHVSVDPNRTSLTGTGGKLEAGKSGGGNWRYGGGFTWNSPELEINDVGFLRSADFIKQLVEVGYLWQKPTKIYRSAQVDFEQFSEHDFEGNFNQNQYELKGKINWKNNWSTVGGFGYKPRLFDKNFLRGGPRFRFSDEKFTFVFLSSDERKKFNFTLGWINSSAKDDNFSFKRYVLRFNYQPLNALNFEFETALNENPNKTQYVTTVNFGADTRYVLGAIDQKTWSTSLRVNYSINPNLSIQFYGSPFITRGRYSDFNVVTNGTAANLSDRVSWFDQSQIEFTDKPIKLDLNNDGKYEHDYKNGGYLIDENKDAIIDYAYGNPDFSFVQFRSNLVVRWEYIPGSELFLVWSRGASGSANINRSLTGSVNNLVFNQASNDTFLIKATYRFTK
jgi:hypothetical protein